MRRGLLAAYLIYAHICAGCRVSHDAVACCYFVSTLPVLTLKFASKETALLHFDTDVHSATRIMIRADGYPGRTRGVRLHGLEG
jgi:hypothetical protein